MELARFERWQETLRGFCEAFLFPIEAKESLAADLLRLLTHPSSRFPAVMAGYEDEYRKNGADAGFSHGEALESLSRIAEETGVSPYSAHLLFYILLSPLLREIYLREGIPEEIFRSSMEDLRCKLYECRQVYGVWGSFVAIWFSRFFRLTLFGIGRLEFAPLRLSAEDAAALKACFSPKDGGNPPEIPPGALLIDTHIPSKGRLPHADVLAAYRTAAAFFRSRFSLAETGGEAVFICESWMLDPAHFTMPEMKNCANLLAFQRDYRLIRQGKDPDGGDLWRIFGMNVDPGDPAAVARLPEDTALRRAYKRRLLEGDLPGYGVGVYFWKDGLENASVRNGIREKEGFG